MRPTNEPPETLVGRRAGTIRFAVYGAKSYLASCDQQRPDWIAAEDSLPTLATYRWREKHYPDAQITARIDSLMGCYEAVKAGIGLAFLPMALGETDPKLERYGARHKDFAIDLWLLTHPDLQHMQRIRAFLRLAGEEIKRMKQQLEGYEVD